MAYDEELAHRIREATQDVDGVVEMRMFGGLAFLVGGNMAVAASGNGGLMVRVAPEHGAELLSEAHAEPMEMRGRSMTGWLRVVDAGIDSDTDLVRWVARGVTYAQSLPAKKR